jgi:hypothetical protein
VLYAIDCIFYVLYAIKNGIEHIKKHNQWRRAQILISNGIEHTGYSFSWHTRNFLVFFVYYLNQASNLTVQG